MEAACQQTLSKKTPTLELSSVMQLPERTNCLACSEDGRYLGLGHSQGLSVWCASSLICIGQWSQETVEITSVQMTRMADRAYLLATVDDMGVARVFASHGEGIHLLGVINSMENINKRSICLTFEISEGGDYGAVSISCSGALWLEVYRFPTEAWLKETETALSRIQGRDSSEHVDVKWSPAVVVIKVKPLQIPAADSPSDVLQMTDFLSHSLTLEQIFRAGERNISPRRCTHHFLLPCGPFHGNSKAKSPTGFPVAVCVWWSGSCSVLQYLLQKAPDDKTGRTADEDTVPDAVWPNAKEVLCSSVSRCTRYIALGLRDGLVCVWDRRSGSPLSVVVVPASDSALFRIHFVNRFPMTVDHSQTFITAKLHLLVRCKSGVLHMVTTGRGIQSCTVQLTERPKHSGNLPTVMASVPFLQNLVLMMQRNGKLSLQDPIKNVPVCFLVPPTTHLISSPCNPVYALNTNECVLFIKGDEEPSCSSEGGSRSRLLVFRFGECDVTKQYIISLPGSGIRQVTLEESCDLYIQQRAMSVDERSKAVKQNWKRLEETAAMMHSGAAASW